MEHAPDHPGGRLRRLLVRPLRRCAARLRGVGHPDRLPAPPDPHPAEQPGDPRLHGARDPMAGRDCSHTPCWSPSAPGPTRSSCCTSRSAGCTCTSGGGSTTTTTRCSSWPAWERWCSRCRGRSTGSSSTPQSAGCATTSRAAGASGGTGKGRTGSDAGRAATRTGRERSAELDLEPGVEPPGLGRVTASGRAPRDAPRRRGRAGGRPSRTAPPERTAGPPRTVGGTPARTAPAARRPGPRERSRSGRPPRCGGGWLLSKTTPDTSSRRATLRECVASGEDTQ